MKRFFLFFVSLILVVSAVSFSVLAAETYFFDTSTFVETSGFGGFRYDLPEGRYTMTFHIPDSEEIPIPGGDYVSEPFDVLFEGSDFLIRCPVAPVFTDDTLSQFKFYLCYYSSNPEILVVQVPEGEEFSIYDGSLPFTLTRVDLPSTSSLSDLVDTDMVSGVLDQVVELLPVVLVVIVGYIAIRKGIDYLRSFLASS